MKIERSQVEKILISEILGLDPISVILEDFSDSDHHRGKVTLTCFNESWTSSWNSMEMPLKDFILFASTEYLVNSFAPGLSQTVADRSKDQKFMFEHIKSLAKEGDEDYEDICDALHTLRFCGPYDRDDYPSNVSKVLCEPWYLDWPSMPNHKYLYLTRIVEAVEKAVRQIVEEDR